MAALFYDGHLVMRRKRCAVQNQGITLNGVLVSFDLKVPIGFAGRTSAPVFFSFPKRRLAKYSLATRTALVNISLDACGNKMRKRPSLS